MGIATDMKKLGEEIIASYDMRVRAIGELVKDTHTMLDGFHTEHGQMCAALRADLAKGEKDRLKDFTAMMSDIEKFVADITKTVSQMMKRFEQEHKAMADELRGSLDKGETERLKDFESMMANIRKAIKEIETFVANKLKEFDAAHADMSKELKKDLAKYVAGVVSETKKLLAGFEAESKKMAANWQKLSATMFRRRGGKMPRVKVEAAEEVKTVEEAVANKVKGKKKAAKKSKSGKQAVSADM